MLENLHVKILALIDEIEVEFCPGLNILTGETGAGKFDPARIGESGAGRQIFSGSAADRSEIRTGGTDIFRDRGRAFGTA